MNKRIEIPDSLFDEIVAALEAGPPEACEYDSIYFDGKEIDINNLTLTRIAEKKCETL